MPTLPGLQYIAELVVYDAGLPGTRTLYYSTHGYTTAAGETPASQWYDARILQPAFLRRTMFDQGTTMGASACGFGELVLANDDAGLDALLDYGFDGRSLTIRQAPAGTVAYPSGWTTVLVATMATVELVGSRVTIKLRDRQYELQKPLQTTKYAGDNALPAGLEGVATDLKGKPKPVCYGLVKNVPAPCVNTSKLIYQVADAAVNSVDAVYDRGIALGVGATYANSTDLLDDTKAPAAGTFKAYPGGGYFRLGSSPDSIITADVTQGANAAARTAGQMFTNILTRAGKSGADWSSGDITALDAANAAVLGLWVGTDEASCDAVCSSIAQSVGAWWGVDRAGLFRIKQVVAPTATAVATFTANDIVGLPQRLTTGDPGAGLPTYRTTIRYGKNYTPTRTDFAATGVGQSLNGAVPAIPLGVVNAASSGAALIVIPTGGSASTIITLTAPGATAWHQRVTVVGQETAADIGFSDEIWIQNSAATPTVGVVSSVILQGAPRARTYAISGTSITLAFGGGAGVSYNVSLYAISLRAK